MIKLVLLALVFTVGSVSFGQANTSLSNLTSPTAINQDLIFGVNSGDHYVKTGATDNMILQSGGGMNIFSGSSVQIEAGGDGPMLLQTSNTSDIDVNSGGGVVFQNGPGYWTTFYGESVYMDTDHGLQLAQSADKPTCDSSRQGTIYYAAGAAGVADQLLVCMKAADDTYSWVTK